MDSSLSSSRYAREGTSRGGFRGRGRGRGRGSFRNDSRQDHSRYSPYPPAGRFQHKPQHQQQNRPQPSTNQDPSAVMMQTLTSMMAQMGDWAAASKRLAEVGPSSLHQERGLVRVFAKNVQDLVGFLCTEKNASLFLSFEMDAAGSSATAAAGPLATLTVSCAATLPLQTPCYVALTLALEECLTASSEPWKLQYQGYAQRCIDYASQTLFTQLDVVLGVVPSANDEEMLVDSFLRCKLLLRYLALLAQAGLLTAYLDHDQDMLQATTMPSGDTLSFYHVLVLLTTAAKNASRWSSLTPTGNSHKHVMILLTTLVLSTIPYAINCLPPNLISILVDQIDLILFSSHNNNSPVEDNGIRYTSPFVPGQGPLAILLAKEQKDDVTEEDEPMDEEEDEDEDEEGPICADSLQDLFRTIRKLTLTQGNMSSKTHFCFLWDQPWACLVRPKDSLSQDHSQDSLVPLVFSKKSLFLKLPNTCQFAPIFFNLTSTAPTSFFNCHFIDGIVFGRLAMFENLADDDEVEVEENTQEDAVVGPMDSYIRTFRSIDRYLLSDVIRDVLISHRPRVSDTGIEKGSCKEVAEQLMSLEFLFSQKDSESRIPGVEYGMIETLLALLIQSPCSTLSSTSPLSHIYLSRVVLELIKHQPQIITPSLAIAVSIVVEHVIPILTPPARDNFSKWFAFHLNNTDYQWSSECWNRWAPYVLKGMAQSDSEKSPHRNSRGEFILDTVQFMMELVSSPDVVATDCLPNQSALVNYIVSSFEDPGASSIRTIKTTTERIQSDLVNKLWNNKEDPESVLAYLLHEAQSISIENHVLVRTQLMIHSIFHPAEKYRQQLQSFIQSAFQESMDSTNMEEVTKDVVRDISDAIMRYKSVLETAISHDVTCNEANPIKAIKGFFKGIGDTFSRYKTVIQSAVSGASANETSHTEAIFTENDRRIEAQLYIITEMKNLLSFSDTFFNICLTLLVKVDILKEISVLMWSLAQPYGCSDDSFQHVSKHWSDLSACAMVIGIETRLKADADILMITDATASEGSDSLNDKLLEQRIRPITDFVNSMLHYATERVLQLDTVIQSNRGKYPSAWEVDLKEGLKFLNFFSVRSVLSALEKDAEIKDMMKTSSMSSLEQWVEHLGLKGHATK